jgi:hypothetical protein
MFDLIKFKKKIQKNSEKQKGEKNCLSQCPENYAHRKAKELNEEI